MSDIHWYLEKFEKIQVEVLTVKKKRKANVFFITTMYWDVGGKIHLHSLLIFTHIMQGSVILFTSSMVRVSVCYYSSTALFSMLRILNAIASKSALAFTKSVRCCWIFVVISAAFF